MTANSIDYGRAAARQLRDKPHVRGAITGATLAKERAYEEAYRTAQASISAWKDAGSRIRRHVLANLADYLEQTFENLQKNGMQVHWADDAHSARKLILELCETYRVKRIVKGKSMLSEELGLNPALEEAGLNVTETDLGEYLIQLAGERPSHIIGPAYHKPLSESQKLFAERLGTAEDATPEVIAAAARQRLRDAFLKADLVITGANFVAADTGTVVLVENEGNIRIGTSAAKVHIACVGIEKIVPRLEDLGTMLPLLSRAATGQQLGNYISLISGPRNMEPDGAEVVHVVFVDNGRAKVLEDTEMSSVLSCIRCGACLNTCPVFRQTGGHPYQWAYSGPIGAALAPALLGLERAWKLPQASTLCGACADACPVRIPLPSLLRTWRSRAVEQGLTNRSEEFALGAYTILATKYPRFFRLAARNLPTVAKWGHNLIPPLKHWLRGRSLPGGRQQP